MTRTDLLAIIADSGYEHAEFVVGQYASQAGSDAAAPLLADLDRMLREEQALAEDLHENDWARVGAALKGA